MDVVQVVSKGNFNNILQSFVYYIYRETHLNIQLNNKSTLSHKKIFEYVIQQKHAG